MTQDLTIEKTIKYFAKIPGLGPRSAKRAVLHILKNKEVLVRGLIETLKDLEENIKECEICHNFTTLNVCEICSNQQREKNTLCIVEEVDDLWNFEKSGIFKGVYHCLGGSLSAVAGITPENLNLQSLFSRLSQGNFEEIIFANNLSVEGATTTFYILEEINQLKLAGVLKSDIKITELANGIPVGGSLEFMDEGTIKASFNSRKNID
jgi:recombination protein RecR